MFFYFIPIFIIFFDQLTKWMILDDMPVPFEVTPFFNIVLAMNKGVSFSLFASDTAWMPWVLTGIGGLITALIAYWFFKEKKEIIKLALALILGGAVGNIIDRVRFGAVVDFLDFHAFGYHWPAFNIADMMICFGVFLIVIEAIFSREKEE